MRQLLRRLEEEATREIPWTYKERDIFKGNVQDAFEKSKGDIAITIVDFKKTFVHLFMAIAGKMDGTNGTLAIRINRDKKAKSVSNMEAGVTFNPRLRGSEKVVVPHKVVPQTTLKSWPPSPGEFAEEAVDMAVQLYEMAIEEGFVANGPIM